MTNRILIVLSVFIIFACSSSQTSESTTDSTSIDSIPPRTEESAPSEEPPQPEIVASDTGAFDAQYSTLSQVVTDSSGSYFQVSVITKQYESSSDVTWYFDRSFSPRYFKETWSMEGTEGSTEYIIDFDRVVCAIEDESYGSGSESIKWCDKVGGTKSTWTDGADSPENTLVASDFGKTCNDGLTRYLVILKTLLKDGQIIEDTDNMLTVRVENVINVGNEVTESTEVHIDKALYEELK